MTADDLADLMTLDLIRALPDHYMAKAAQDAVRYHGAQVRKDGTPYVAHLFAVAADVASDHGADPVTVVLALLHDLVEDHGTELPAGYVADRYGDELAALLDAVTHRPGEPRVDYIGRVIAGGPICRRVKVADLAHNYLHLDSPGIADVDFFRLKAKYEAELARLAPLVADDQETRGVLRPV